MGIFLRPSEICFLIFETHRSKMATIANFREKMGYNHEKALIAITLNIRKLTLERKLMNVESLYFHTFIYFTKYKIIHKKECNLHKRTLVQNTSIYNQKLYECRKT